jgi:hypothetical protein
VKTRLGRVVASAVLALCASSAAALSTATAASASSPYWGIPEYDGSGRYVGCYSPYTGKFFTPAQITEDGCNSDWGEEEAL